MGLVCERCAERRKAHCERSIYVRLCQPVEDVNFLKAREQRRRCQLHEANHHASVNVPWLCCHECREYSLVLSRVLCASLMAQEQRLRGLHWRGSENSGFGP